MVKSKRFGGRPVTRKAKPGEKLPLAIRVSPALKRQLESASNRAGRSITQEVESRLDRSFERQDLIAELLRAILGEQVAELLLHQDEGSLLLTHDQKHALLAKVISFVDSIPEIEVDMHAEPGRNWLRLSPEAVDELKKQVEAKGEARFIVPMDYAERMEQRARTQERLDGEFSTEIANLIYDPVEAAKPATTDPTQAALGAIEEALGLGSAPAPARPPSLSSMKAPLPPRVPPSDELIEEAKASLRAFMGDQPSDDRLREMAVDAIFRAWIMKKHAPAFDDALRAKIEAEGRPFVKRMEMRIYEHRENELMRLTEARLQNPSPGREDAEFDAEKFVENLFTDIDQPEPPRRKQLTEDMRQIQSRIDAELRDGPKEKAPAEAERATSKKTKRV